MWKLRIPFNEIDTSQCNVDPEQLAEMGRLRQWGWPRTADGGDR